MHSVPVISVSRTAVQADLIMTAERVNAGPTEAMRASSLKKTLQQLHSFST
jgi:hypothetical protein